MTTDEERVAFLRWCLPRLGLRWPGYRKVRRLVGKRMNRRIAELGLSGLAAYRAFLAREAGEWAQLDAMCRIPISRFYRDRGVFDAIARHFLPDAAAATAARGGDCVRCWSAGCAAGEEPYTLSIAWHLGVAGRWPQLGFAVIATDAEETTLVRAQSACYGASSLKDLPPNWRERAFVKRGALFCLAPEFRGAVRFEKQDIREKMPEGPPFDLVLCRNLVFTYFEEPLQRSILTRLSDRMRPGGLLVLGNHEVLPPATAGFVRIGHLPILARASMSNQRTPDA